MTETHLIDAKPMAKPMDEREKGFIQGQAWAIAIMLTLELDGEQLFGESGLTLDLMRRANVLEHDRGPIRNHIMAQRRWEKKWSGR